MALYDPGIKTTYNFAYRLSGSLGAARNLTEKAILNNIDYPCDNTAMLKQVWKDYLKNYQKRKFYGEDNIQRGLLNLPPKLRCLVILRTVLGCSYPQISVILDMPEKEAANKMGEGLGLLRRHLDD